MKESYDKFTTETLGDVYFDTSPFAYVAPSNDKAQEYLSARQDSYITNREQLDKINLQKKIAYNSSNSKTAETFKNAMKLIDDTTSLITKDNMADSTIALDDLNRKLMMDEGLLEINEEYKTIQEKENKIQEEAKALGHEDPNHVNYLVQKLYKGATGVTKDENGKIVKSVVPDVPVPPFVAIGKDAMEQFDGFKADNLIKRNADGTFNVDKSIQGYFNLLNTESVTAQELKEAMVNYYGNDVKTQAYLDSFAEMQLDKVGNPINYLKSLKPEEKLAVFGKDISEEELINLLQSQETANALAKEIIKAKEIENQIQPAIAKHSYTKETLTTLKDDILLKALDSQAKIEEEEIENNNVVISLTNLAQKSTIDKNDIKSLFDNKEKVKTSLNETKATINQYKQKMLAKEPGYTDEGLAQHNETLAILNKQLEQAEKTQRNLHDIVTTDYKEAVGSDFTKDYNDNLPETIKMVKIENTAKLLNTTSIPGADGAIGTTNYRIKLPKDAYFKSATSNNYIVNGKSFNYSITPTDDDNLIYIDKNGDAFLPSKYVDTKNESGKYIVPQDAVFTENGELTDNIYKINKIGVPIPGTILGTTGPITYSPATDGIKLGTEEDAKEALLKAYQSDEYMFFDKQFNDKGKIINGKILKNYEKIQDKFGNLDERNGLNVHKNVFGVSIANAGAKHPSKYYTGVEENLRNQFSTNYDTFVTKGPDGKDMTLNSYLKEIDSDLDMTKVNLEATAKTLQLALDRDLNYGQNYHINLVLNEEGRKEVDRASIPLLINNPNKDRKNEDINIANALKSLLSATSKADNSYNVLARQLGDVYLALTPDEQVFENMKLYTLLPGESEEATFFSGLGTPDKVKITAHAIDPKKGTTLRNTDFTMSKISEVNGAVLTEVNVIDKTGNSVWVSEVEYNNNKKDYTPILYDTPEDVKKYLGAQWLSADATKSGIKNNNPNTSSIPVNSKESFTVSDNVVERGDYNNYLKSLRQPYNTVDTYKLNGKNVESRIPKNELVLLSDIGSKKQIDSKIELPYINVNIKNQVQTLLSDFQDLLVTGGFRGDNTHTNLQKAGDNSLHKYGLALDFAYNNKNLSIIDKIKNNPTLLNKYGILRIEVKPQTNHIHVEFKSNV
jgi:hypothetical protein